MLREDAKTDVIMSYISACALRDIFSLASTYESKTFLFHFKLNPFQHLLISFVWFKLTLCHNPIMP